MNRVYIIGYNGFIAKNIYLTIKKHFPTIILLAHDELSLLESAKNDDIIINCSGLNRAETYEEYEKGNYNIVQYIIEKIKLSPFLIHFSSLMVYGFKNQVQLQKYQEWFITSKLKADDFLLNNYDRNKLCIVRPSNIFGYNCKPFYNNILVTLIYEKINNIVTPKKINKNCIRNFISIEGLCSKILEIMNDKKFGLFNIISSNTVNLKNICDIIYSENNHIEIVDDAESIPNTDLNIKDIIVEEDLKEKIFELEINMKNYYKLINNITVIKKNCLIQSRGEMVEITDINSKRLYKITVSQNSIRGNHYHYKQIEDFYINKGKVLFILSHCDFPNITHIFTSYTNELIRILPEIIHTVVNDFHQNECEIIISSTQEYITNEIPDTKYINNI